MLFCCKKLLLILYELFYNFVCIFCLDHLFANFRKFLYKIYFANFCCKFCLKKCLHFAWKHIVHISFRKKFCEFCFNNFSANFLADFVRITFCASEMGVEVFKKLS